MTMAKERSRQVLVITFRGDTIGTKTTPYINGEED